MPHVAQKVPLLQALRQRVGERKGIVALGHRRLQRHDHYRYQYLTACSGIAEKTRALLGEVPSGRRRAGGRHIATTAAYVRGIVLVSRFATAVVQLDMQRAEHTSLMTLVGGLQVVQPA